MSSAGCLLGLNQSTGSFGSSSGRFVHQAPSSPGPGHYNSHVAFDALKDRGRHPYVITCNINMVWRCSVVCVVVQFRVCVCVCTERWLCFSFFFFLASMSFLSFVRPLLPSFLPSLLPSLLPSIFPLLSPQVSPGRSCTIAGYFKKGFKRTVTDRS